MAASELSLDDYDRDRRHRRDVALRRISRLNRWWLIGQLATAVAFGTGFVVLGPWGWPATLSLLAAMGLSVLAAGGSAGVTLWNWSVLPGIWRAVGLAPWAILLAEATFVVWNLA